MTFEGLAERGTAIARGLGFAFVVYFLTAFLRDAIGLSVPGGWFVDAVTGGPGGPWIGLAICLVTVALAFLLVRLYSRTGPNADRPRPLLRLNGSWAREWFRGALLGGGLATVVIAPLVMGRETEILGFARDILQRPHEWLAVVLILVLEAAREELGFRGPAQRELTRAVSFPVAAIFLAFSFAIIHGGNPAVGRLGLVGIFVAGLALAGLARARGDLGMVCGVHAGWNVALGLVWSLPVSGLQLDPVLLSTSSNRSIWTGGSFGVEASVPAVVVLLLFGFVTWRLPAAACEGDDRCGEPAAPGGSGSSVGSGEGG